MISLNCEHEKEEKVFTLFINDAKMDLCAICVTRLMDEMLKFYNTFNKEEKKAFHKFCKMVRDEND